MYTKFCMAQSYLFSFVSSKYAPGFDSSSSYRRKQNGLYGKDKILFLTVLLFILDSYSSDMETHKTGSFDLLPQPSSYNKRLYHSYYAWKPQRTSIYRRSCVLPLHQSVSIGNGEHENYKIRSRSLTSPKMLSRKYTNQDFYYQRRTPTTYPPTTYRSSLYINPTHTYKRLQERIHQKKLNGLYLDLRTGII